MSSTLERTLGLKQTTLTANADYYLQQAGLSSVDSHDGSNSCTKTYIISAAVSDLVGSGTTSTVQITLHGTKGSSAPVTISKLFSPALITGEQTTQHFDLPDVGDLLTVDIQLSSLILSDALHLRYLIVVDARTKKVNVFPCYRWISSKTTVRNGIATLPFQDKDAALLNQRQSEIKERQATYSWGNNNRYKGFPGYVNAEKLADLPADLQFADIDKLSFVASAATAKAVFGLKLLVSKEDKVPDFKGFFEIGKGMGTQGDDLKVMTKIYENWTRDEEFGYQYLNGHNPVVLEKCTSIPPNFPVEKELNNQGFNINIGADIKTNSFYIANYAVLDNLLKPEEKSATAFFCAPICLFRVLPSGDLVPIAIQLNQQPSDTNPIWTPRDGFGWLLAKIYVRNADIQIHQAVTHLLKTHLILEAISTAMWRQLPEAHPVFKMLVPHTRTTLAINTAARESLINDGGLVDITISAGIKGAYEAVRRAFSIFKIQDLIFPEALKARGVDNASNLPNCYFRDDGLKLWSIIQSYVEEMVGLYYHNDIDITQDSELQAWISDLYTNGFPSSSSGDHHGLKSRLELKAELSSFLASIIFQATAGHASVNFSQMGYYGFAPNAPAMLRLPAPTSKSGITLDVLLKTMPNTSDVSNQLSTVYVLSRYSEAEIFVGVFPELHFSEEAPNNAMKKLKSNLDKLNSELLDRNSKLGLSSYPYMMPSLVPNSIAK